MHVRNYQFMRVMLQTCCFTLPQTPNLMHSITLHEFLLFTSNEEKWHYFHCKFGECILNDPQQYLLVQQHIHNIPFTLTAVWLVRIGAAEELHVHKMTMGYTYKN